MLVKLRHLPRWSKARAIHADTYEDLPAGVGDLVFQQRAPQSTHVHHLFVVETEQRDALKRHLDAAGIQTGIHCPIPVHLQPAYADPKHEERGFPVTERPAARMLSLPMFPELSPDQVARVVEEIGVSFAPAPREEQS
jgi:dTDP-4-amino-4,6-dideoxygalactose transaminase